MFENEDKDSVKSRGAASDLETSNTGIQSLQPPTLQLKSTQENESQDDTEVKGRGLEYSLGGSLPPPPLQLKSTSNANAVIQREAEYPKYDQARYSAEDIEGLAGAKKAYVTKEANVYTYKTSHNSSKLKKSKSEVDGKEKKIYKNSMVIILPSDNGPDGSGHYRIVKDQNRTYNKEARYAEYVEASAILYVGLTDDEMAQTGLEEEKSSILDKIEDAEQIKEIYDSFIGNDGISGYVDYLSKTRYEDWGSAGRNKTDVRGLEEGDAGYSASNMETAKNLAFVGDGSAAVFGLLNMAKTLKGVGQQDSKLEEVENFVDYLHAGMKVTEGVGKVVGAAGDASEKAVEVSGNVGVLAEHVTHDLGFIKSGIMLIKKALELAKQHNEMTAEEKAQASLGMIKDATTMAQEAMYGVKNIYEVFNNGVVPSDVMAAIPGLGIAISGVDLIMQGYHAINALLHKKQMDDIRDSIAKKHGDELPSYVRQGPSTMGPSLFPMGPMAPTMDVSISPDDYAVHTGKSKMNEKLSGYMQREAKIANMKAVIEMDKAISGKNEMTAEEARQNAILIDNFKLAPSFLKLSSTYRSAKKKKAAYDEAQEKDRRIAQMEEMLANEKQALADYMKRQNLEDNDEFQEYELSKELASINAKRAKRSAIHILADVASITGDILNLTGVGGIGGGIAKASGAALEAGAFVARTGKQVARDKGARQEVKGKEGFFSKHTNTSKSSYAKDEKRKKHAIYILKMIRDLDIEPGREEMPKAAAKLKRTHKYIEATGISPKRLAATADPFDMIKLLMKAMAEREV